MFGSNGKFHFPENGFLLTEIFTFDPEMILHPHFHFKSFSEREREREREPRSESTDRRSTSGAIDKWCDRPTSALDDRTTRRSRSRDDRDRAVFSFFWVCLDLSFPCSSLNTRKYFSEIFLKCNQIHENIFLFGK